MLNSSFIQGFELDDYYPAAPLHSNSILIPAMLPILQKHPEVTGREFLLSLILGYEVGTRVGLALHGSEMLSRGWHSGVVFGCAAAAVSAGKLLQLSAASFEDAIGIASTQACGLMSAQFESMIKRMQHGFAARNGLYGAVLAERGYVGIKRVLEREYGAFLPVFGEGHHPDATQITVGLGDRWTTTEIAVKPYAAMGGVHAGIDASLSLRAKKAIVPDQVKSILIEVGEAAFSHGGFPIRRPIEPITAQMSLRYSVAIALLDGAALLKQFSQSRINADDVWNLIGKSDVQKIAAFDQKPHTGYTTQVTIEFQDGCRQQELIEMPTGGADRPLNNDAIVAKFRTLSSSVTGEDRIGKLQNFVLNIDKAERAATLLDLLRRGDQCARLRLYCQLLLTAWRLFAAGPCSSSRMRQLCPFGLVSSARVLNHEPLMLRRIVSGPNFYPRIKSAPSGSLACSHACSFQQLLPKHKLVLT